MSETAMDAYLRRMRSAAHLSAFEEKRLSEIMRRGRRAQASLAANQTHRTLPKGEIVELEASVLAAHAARNRFMCANLRLVVSIARRSRIPAGMELLDLVQEGNLGLERAVWGFDGRKGFKFSGYATVHIRAAIGAALDKQSTLVRVPYAPRAALRTQLNAVGGDEQKLNASSKMVFNLTSPLSLDHPLSHDSSYSFADTLACEDRCPEQMVQDAAIVALTRELIERLPPRSASVLGLWLGLDGEPRSQTDIAKQFGVTHQAIHYTIKKAVRSISEHVHDQPALWEDLADAS